MKLAILLILGQVALFASSGSGTGETDIIGRVINFAIFVAILYYLIADRVVRFFKDRILAISNDLERAQAKLKEVKKNKEEALSRLEAAKRDAEEIVRDAKKEAELIASKIRESLLEDLKNYEKHARDAMELERRRVQRGVVNEVLAELFSDPSTSINDKNLPQIVLKRVA